MDLISISEPPVSFVLAKLWCCYIIIYYAFQSSHSSRDSPSDDWFPYPCWCRLDRRYSIVDLRVELQDLDRFSIFNRFAKFQGRSQSSGSGASPPDFFAYRSRPAPQRCVTANPAVMDLPDGVQCLSLWPSLDGLSSRLFDCLVKSLIIIPLHYSFDTFLGTSNQREPRGSRPSQKGLGWVRSKTDR